MNHADAARESAEMHYLHPEPTVEQMVEQLKSYTLIGKVDVKTAKILAIYDALQFVLEWMRKGSNKDTVDKFEVWIPQKDKLSWMRQGSISEIDLSTKVLTPIHAILV
jgi:hypothetical protein